MKKIFILQLLFAAFFAGDLAAQCPMPQGSLLQFSTQDDIDQFLVNWPNCTMFSGSIEITGTVTNLNGLQNINTIEGALIIEEADNLVNLTGLENLSMIGSFLTVLSNDSLTDMLGLENLISIGEYFRISHNDDLTDIVGFQNLTTLGGGLRISHNNSLIHIDAFQSLPTIVGGLLISDNDDLISISGLGQLSHIGERVEIGYNYLLNDIDGLQNLATIGGNLYIENNIALANISGFQNLSTIGGRLIIEANNSLIDVQGLQNLSTIGGDLLVHSNNHLTNIEDFQNLSTIGGELRITSNFNLTSLVGFENLSDTLGLLRIQGNALLTNLDGLENLSMIEEDIVISINNSLTNLDALHNIDSIGGDLWIKFNDSLVSISGLENLSGIGGYLWIQGNAILSSCSILSICNMLTNETPNGISDNAPSCNSDVEILYFCEEFGKIHFPLFYDINENTVQDSGEFFLPTASVLIEPGECSAFGNFSNGGFKYLSFGDYTISYNQNNNPLWELTNNTNAFNFTLNETNTSDTIFYGLKPTAMVSDVELALVNSLPRCNELVTFDVIVSNSGTTIVDGILWFTIDQNILNVNYIDPPDTLIVPNIYGWQFTNLFPGYTLKKQISLSLPGPPNLAIGELLEFETALNYTDVNTSEGFLDDKSFIEVQCAYDPNDKLASPIYPDNYALINENLIYTIRFQNTGNAEAYEVVITDELDSNLDLSTFQYLTSSHESVLSTFLEGRNLTFEFKDIFLPDSTTNFDESQGYVMYSIRAKSDVEEYTSIENTANIFFDYNPAVVTNTTENTMISSFDFDGDGFELWADCDDNNAQINPAAIEELYNGFDDDCDPATLDDDLDQDGFGFSEDCDDMDPLLGSISAMEIPYNGIDDDCNELTLDDDLDQDGFVLVDDCDDNNILVNPDAIEEPYNGLDDDCNQLTLDDDFDQDGFLLADDCDDENPTINTAAEEIPNNGIDEDCDGEDLITNGMNSIVTTQPQIFPSPTTGQFQILFPNSVQGAYELRAISGKLIEMDELRQQITVNFERQPEGVYILLMKTEDGVWAERVVKQ